MNLVKTQSHYGSPVLLDQCPECGGIWFDQAELYRVRLDESVNIEIDKEALTKEKILNTPSLFCPRDRSPLKSFKDPHFPEELIVESCSSCGGFWFNRGEFENYRDYRRQKINQPSDEKLEEEVRLMLEAEGVGGKYQTLAKLSQFLLTPLDRTTLKPLEGRYQNQAHQAVNTVSLIIKILLELFLRR
jgi:Zn-finger nucleic acid-binding protein